MFNGDIVKQLSDNLSAASDINRVLDPKILHPESLDPHDLVDIKPYIDQLENIEKECKVVSASKLDSVPHAKELFDKMHQIDEVILSDLRKSEIESAATLKHIEDQADKFEMELKYWCSKENIDYLTEESLRRLLGQGSLEEERNYLKTHDLKTIFKRSLEDYIGKEFVAEMIRPPTNTLYPTEVKSLKIRETVAQSTEATKPQAINIKEKLKTLLKESDEILSSLQEKLNSNSLIKTYKQLETVDQSLA